MDAHELLVSESEYSVAVVGRAGEFYLFPTREPIDEAAKAAALRRCFGYCGVMGVKNGQASAQCEPTPDAVYTMMHAALAFAQQVADRLRPPTKGDAVEWLESLYRLEDTRG